MVVDQKDVINLPFSIDNLLKNRPNSTRSNFLTNDCDNSKENGPDFFHEKNLSSDAKGYVCGDCGKVFSAHYNLTRHMPIHTGARPFQCKVSFLTVKPNLTKLLKVCGKAFRQASTLCRHKIIHTEEKPHMVGVSCHYQK